MPEPRLRTPAQIEASRRNGARSKGPVTPAGKTRASRNAVKHGLTAMTHLVVEGEDAGELAALSFRMLVETGAVTEIEARVARRLAIAFWKGERAERMEVAVLSAAPKVRPPARGCQWEEADPLTTFDVRRFNAIRGAQAQIGREIKNCLAELRRLRHDPLACTDELEGCAPQEQDVTGEPEPACENEPSIAPRNEPKNALAANDDAAPPAALTPRNEPDSVPTPTDLSTREPAPRLNRHQRRALAAMRRGRAA